MTKQAWHSQVRVLEDAIRVQLCGMALKAAEVLAKQFDHRSSVAHHTG